MKVLKRSVISRQMDRPYPVLLGTSEVQQTYGVDALYHFLTVTVAPDGKVADVHVGVMLKKYQIEWATR